MDPGISEFSYGFALTRELVSRLGLAAWGAPEFPTQNEEGKSGGYDVKLPGLVPIFIQFKVSDRSATITSWPSSSRHLATMKCIVDDGVVLSRPLGGPTPSSLRQGLMEEAKLCRLGVDYLPENTAATEITR